MFTHLSTETAVVGKVANERHLVTPSTKLAEVPVADGGTGSSRSTSVTGVQRSKLEGGAVEAEGGAGREGKRVSQRQKVEEEGVTRRADAGLTLAGLRSIPRRSAK